VNLAVKVRAEVVGVRDELPVRAIRRKPLEILDLQRLVCRPGRGLDAEWNSQIYQFHFLPPDENRL
jgi:hypothetical protein